MTSRIFDSAQALKVSASRLLAVEKQPYLSAALFAMTPLASDELNHMAADDRWRIYFPHEQLRNLSSQEMAGVWLHLAAHCLRNHAARFKALSESDARAALFRKASDAIINQELLEFGFTIDAETPTIASLRDAGIDIPDNVSSERLFRILLNQDIMEASGSEESSEVDEDKLRGTEQPSEGFDCGSCSDGLPRNFEEHNELDALEPVDFDRAESVRAYVAVQIEEFVKAGGEVPPSFRRWSNIQLHPKVDWRQELASLIMRNVALRVGLRNHTYSKPSRRQSAAAALGQGVILPAMTQPAPPKVAIIVDTSASIDSELIDVAMTEVSGILRVVRDAHRGTIFISCDTEASLSRVRQVSDIDLVGGGGTDMRVGIDLAMAQKPPPQLIIIITDGETPWPEEPVKNASMLVVLTEETYKSEVPSWMKSVYVG